MKEPAWYSYLKENSFRAKEIMDAIKDKDCKCDHDVVFELDTFRCTNCFGKRDKYCRIELTQDRCNRAEFYSFSYENFEKFRTVYVGYWVANRLKIWETLRDIAYHNQNGLCVDCNKSLKESKSELHHIIPRVDGGTEDFENLKLLCVTCHYKYAMNGFI